MISIKLEINTRINVFKFKDHKLISWKYFGNLNVQYAICDVGKIKLKKNNRKQKAIGKIDFFSFRLIFGILLKPLDGWWYFAPPLEKFSVKKRKKIMSNKIKDNWFAV